MPFDWREYLQFARKISGEQVDCEEEAELQSGVSRAYYAAFCCARNQARDSLGFSPAYDASDHRRVPTFFSYRGRADIEAMLHWLRDARNTCDYADQVSGKSGGLDMMLYMAILEAEDVIRELPNVK